MISILMVKLSSIGDVVMTTAAARALKKHLPGVRITWVCEPKSAGILEGNPDLDELIVWKRSSIREFIGFARDLRRRRFDVALDFQGLARSALVTLVSGAKRRIGFADGRELSRLAYNETISCPTSLKGGGCYHTTGCYVALIRPLGVNCDDGDGDMRVVVSPEEAQAAEVILARAGVAQDDRIAAFCPATTRDYKHWTEDGWSTLTEMVWGEMRLKPVFLGSSVDRPLIERIMGTNESPAASLAGFTTLKQAAAVIDRSAVVVAVDTGLLHVGVALDKPTVGIFGPTPHWRCHAHRANFAVARREMPCVPCRKKPTCERFECISDVRPEEVLAAVQSINHQPSTVRP